MPLAYKLALLGIGSAAAMALGSVSATAALPSEEVCAEQVPHEVVLPSADSITSRVEAKEAAREQRSLVQSSFRVSVKCAQLDFRNAVRDNRAELKELMKSSEDRSVKQAALQQYRTDTATARAERKAEIRSAVQTKRASKMTVRAWVKSVWQELKPRPESTV